ncbi:MAG TPA: glycosyltransferase family 39 protein [Chloroflexia bacterium]|nr:glycosyltransferase family 39 protein [Chloroflexia bacterium]
MKTQRRSDNGGSLPSPSNSQPHDDYDDYEDIEPSVEASAEDSLDEVEDNAPGRDQDIPDVPVASNGGTHSASAGVVPSTRMRPSSSGPRAAASNLPKRRSRGGEVPSGIGSASTPVVDMPEAPPARKGNGKHGNGLASAAPTVVSSTRGTPTVITPDGGASVPVYTPPETLSSRVFRLIVTYENLIFLIIFALALFTRFWDIGDRGIHHDESLHSVYSRNLYIGIGYTHDPMMHGPIQFNLIAFMYWLFGTSDTTARFASAFCGVWVVMSPFFLRRQMGRWPALIASFLLLISPGVLYFSRMAREDSIFSAMEMIMIVGLWRFISTRRPVDFFVFCAGLSLMFTIKETAYLTVAVVGSLFAILFAVQAGYAIMGALAAYGVAMGGLLLYVSSGMKNNTIGKLPDIPAQNPDYTTIMNFASNLLNHPLVQGAVLISLVFVGLIIGLMSLKSQTMTRVLIIWIGVLAAVRLLAAFIITDSPVNLVIELIAMAVALALGAGVGYLITRGGQLHQANVALDGDGRPVRSGLPSRAYRPTRPASSVPVASGSLPRRRSRTAVEVDLPEADEPSTNGHELEPTVSLSGVDRATGPVPAYAMELDDSASPVYDPRRLDPKPGTLLAQYEPGSLPYLIGSLFSRPSVLVIGALIATTIFVVLYTVFFTDVPRGIASGLFASLGYWMAQQGVARGGQPWYYYFLIVPLYQPIAVFFSLAATTFFSVKGIRGWLRKRQERLYGEREPERLGLFNTDRPVPFAKFSVLLPLFLVWWLGGAFFIYSWAGEKMPWLMMHLTRPAILLASLFLGALLASIIRRRQERIALDAAYVGSYSAPSTSLPERRVATSGRGPAPTRSRTASTAVRAAQPVLAQQEPPWIAWNRPGSMFPLLSFMTLFSLLAMAWGLKLNALTTNGIGTSDYSGWGVSWIYPILMLIVLVAYSVWLGPGRVGRYLGVGIFSVLFLYEFRSATNLVYQHPDVPTEMAVYVQTGPDTTRTVKEINDYSELVTGGTNLKVVYDSNASWPFEWYLRDFKNKQFVGTSTPPTGPDVPIILEDYSLWNPSVLDNKIKDPATNATDLATYKALRDDYIGQRYAMRWWFPEDWYKNDLIKGTTAASSIPQQAGAIVSTTAQTFTNPQMQATLWNYLMFRQTPKPLGSTDMIVFVRKDVVQLYHYLQYEPPQSTDEPPTDIINLPPPTDGTY